MFQSLLIALHFMFSASTPPIAHKVPVVLWKPCSNHIVITASRSILNEEGYERVRRFWEENAPQVRIVFQEEEHTCEAVTNIIMIDLSVLRHWFPEPLAGQFIPQQGEDGGECYTSAFITIYSTYKWLPQEQKEETIAHEVGHAIGLLHRDGTIMQQAGEGPWRLDATQHQALQAHYSAQPQP